MQENIYLALTAELNRGRVRAILSSGQAVVMHRLAMMSKDGDWILREDEECLKHVLAVLDARGARYRLGAPVDIRWMAAGWSAHFEFRTEVLRVRTDFITRPPRVSPDELAALWSRAESASEPIPFVDVETLAQLKKTNREKDYAVIGELARLIEDPVGQMLLSRSARDLVALAEKHPEALEQARRERPLLAHVVEGVGSLEAALDAERRQLMHENERRLEAYTTAAQNWTNAWPGISAEIEGLPLFRAHAIIVERAEDLLPAEVEIRSQ